MSQNTQETPLSLPSEPLPGDLKLGPKTRVGSHSDVYRGTWTHNGEQKEVCIKCLRNNAPATDTSCLNLTPEERFERRIRRETSIWIRSNHSNVLQFLGYQVIDGQPRLVSPWMNNGSLEEYLTKHSNISDVNKLILLQQATEGLAYLHGSVPPIAHGDLKPANILITDELTATLCDMGISRFILDGHTGLTTSGSAGGSSGFQAKELIMGNSLPTLQSDIYAMGGVILETMSGMKPFHKAPTLGMVMVSIVGDQMCQPKDHLGLPSNDPLWPFLRKCWSPKPEERPVVAEVIETLRNAIETQGLDSNLGNVINQPQSETQDLDNNLGNAINQPQSETQGLNSKLGNTINQPQSETQGLDSTLTQHLSTALVLSD